MKRKRGYPWPPCKTKKALHRVPSGYFAGRSSVMVFAKRYSTLGQGTLEALAELGKTAASVATSFSNMAESWTKARAESKGDYPQGGA